MPRIRGGKSRRKTEKRGSEEQGIGSRERGSGVREQGPLPDRNAIADELPAIRTELEKGVMSIETPLTSDSGGGGMANILRY